MNTFELKDRLVAALREQSGLEKHRPYLGMSGIGQCPRKLYLEFVNGRPEPTDQSHWYCWTGYLHEQAIVNLLGEVPARQMEVVADFDERFRGHVDYPLGELVVDIKSVSWDKYGRVRANGTALAEHIKQMQMYMRHGGFARAALVYIARDVPHKEWAGLPLWVYEVEYLPDLADELDAKARAILAAVDAGRPPRCECGWCR